MVQLDAFTADIAILKLDSNMWSTHKFTVLYIRVGMHSE